MNFESIWKEARLAASTTISEPKVFKGCGFAWITISGRGKFAKFAKEHIGVHKNYGGKGFNIWYTHVYNSYSQNMDEHYEACSKAAAVLRKYGIEADVNCRYD